ncbi:rhomboid family intramembrane serine protease [Kitasatospora sp. NBC_01250]|uniref:rhomboid family intramembrane serine protease n=1 Tax=unclassified Kitasatospora TaxID=2633591 RepID=UPI002E136273|nr:MULTISPECIES: rhomboid family intramembrane serine protease [unclassified Kitasatospora]WSJ68092.1 rhomboid family intramembrane serine protease [Kitasatospora sp. NBC_01302]
MAEHDLRSAEARMIAEARKAFFVVFGLLCVVWAVQLGNWADRNTLALQYGIRPHDLTRLPELFTAPLLHFSWQHLEGNSGPLFVFGFLAAYRGVKKFLLLTLLITLTSGLAVWIFQAGNTVSVGASGLIFGYLGYVVLRGIFDRHLIDTLIGVVMAASFAYELAGAVPGAPDGVSWLAHLGGLLGGVAGAWLLRDRAGREERATAADRPAPGGGPAGSGTGSRADLLKELKDLGL